MLQIMPKVDGDAIILTLPYVHFGDDCILITDDNIEEIKNLYTYDEFLTLLTDFSSNSY
jgi:hypothetical protein